MQVSVFTDYSLLAIGKHKFQRSIYSYVCTFVNLTGHTN